MSDPRATTCCCNMKMIVIVILMATLYYPALIDTASVRLECFQSSKQEQRDFALLQSQRNARIRRATESIEEEEDMPKRNCYNTACGWAVYNPLTRTVEYFMKNTSSDAVTKWVFAVWHHTGNPTLPRGEHVKPSSVPTLLPCDDEVIGYNIGFLSCECPDKSYKCVRAGDDLSASAYVYRCRQNTTADDIESPEDAN